tara:strand:+ start:430 stop:633 length:204 start_codon:yes stop_codon:yes gene_type:complete
MTNKSTETRVFVCFIIILIFLSCTGCSTTNRWIWEHKPENKTPMIGPANEHDKDVGGIKINVLEVSF